jgi:hypothetical protein
MHWRLLLSFSTVGTILLRPNDFCNELVGAEAAVAGGLLPKAATARGGCGNTRLVGDDGGVDDVDDDDDDDVASIVRAAMAVGVMEIGLPCAENTSGVGW